MPKHTEKVMKVVYVDGQFHLVNPDGIVIESHPHSGRVLGKIAHDLRATEVQYNYDLGLDEYYIPSKDE
jgi:hypothetical protein